MKQIFEPMKMNHMELKNRLAAPPPGRELQTSCGVVVSGQFNYTKGTGIYAFYIAYIIEFSWFNTLLGVGSFSNLFSK